MGARSLVPGPSETTCAATHLDMFQLVPFASRFVALAAATLLLKGNVVDCYRRDAEECVSRALDCFEADPYEWDDCPSEWGA